MPLEILLVEATPGSLAGLAAGLAGPAVALRRAASGAEATAQVAAAPPHLVVIDRRLSDQAPLALVSELMRLNALVNTAVASELGEEEFHQKSEGLGILCRLPAVPGPADAGPLLARLRAVLGQA